MMMHPGPDRSLRSRLGDGILVVPGAANALTARMVEDAGFGAVYVSGAGISNTFLGMPDLGLLTLSQLADHVAAMREVVSIPMIVDADTGFGNAVGTRHTVRVLERAGADAVQIEDQVFPKRCGHFDGTAVIPADEMEAKIRAAAEARTRDDLLIVARTDARAAHGLDEACRRAERYREAGADILFVEAPRTYEEVEQVAARVQGPLLLNSVRGGRTPDVAVTDLERMGYAIVLHANLALLATIAGVQDVLAELGGTGSTGVRVASWDERQRLVGLERFQELEHRYAEVAEAAEAAGR